MKLLDTQPSRKPPDPPPSEPPIHDPPPHPTPEEDPSDNPPPIGDPPEKREKERVSTPVLSRAEKPAIFVADMTTNTNS